MTQKTLTIFCCWKQSKTIKSLLIKIQPDATVCRYLLTAKSFYTIRVSQHPSSGVLKPVTAASGTGHNTGTATSLQRGPIGPRWREVRRVGKIEESDYYLRHVCVPVRLSVPKEQLGSHLTNVNEMFYLGIFRKFVSKVQVLLKTVKSNVYFRCKPVYSYGSISLSSS